MLTLPARRKGAFPTWSLHPAARRLALRALTAAALTSLAALAAPATRAEPPADPVPYTILDAPGAVSTFVHAINNRGQILGTYVGQNGNSYAFVYEAGVYTVLAPPDGARGVTGYGINDKDQIVGQVLGSDSAQHGFLYHRGVYTTLDISGAVATYALGINDKGQVVGYYIDSASIRHGFVLTLLGRKRWSAQGTVGWETPQKASVARPAFNGTSAEVYVKYRGWLQGCQQGLLTGDILAGVWHEDEDKGRTHRPRLLARASASSLASCSIRFHGILTAARLSGRVPAGGRRCPCACSLSPGPAPSCPGYP